MGTSRNKVGCVPIAEVCGGNDSRSGPRLLAFLPDLGGGGAERSITELLAELKRVGVEIALVVADGSGPIRGELSPGIRLVDLRLTRTAHALLPLACEIRRFRPHTILSALDHGNVLATAAAIVAGYRCRRVLCQRSIMSYERAHASFARRVVWRTMLALAFRCANRIVCNSGAVQQDLQRFLWLDGGASIVIRNALDAARLEHLAREPLDQESLCWIGEDRLVIAVGSLEPVKNHSMLIDALGELSESERLKMVVLGEGGLRTLLSQRAASLGVQRRLRMPGYDPNPFRWMARADILVHPSMSEGCPNVVLQAMSLGVHVIGLRGVSAMEELAVRMPGAITLTTADAGSLARCINQAIARASKQPKQPKLVVDSPSAVAHAYLAVLFGDSPTVA